MTSVIRWEGTVYYREYKHRADGSSSGYLQDDSLVLGSVMKAYLDEYDLKKDRRDRYLRENVLRLLCEVDDSERVK